MCLSLSLSTYAPVKQFLRVDKDKVCIFNIHFNYFWPVSHIPSNTPTHAATHTHTHSDPALLQLYHPLPIVDEGLQLDYKPSLCFKSSSARSLIRENK